MPAEARPPLRRLPRMPFSSPSIDSIVSPATPTSLNSERLYRASPSGGSDHQLESEPGQGRRWRDNMKPEMKAETEKASSKIDQSIRSKVPELNLITNFAYPPPVHHMTAVSVSTTRAKGINHCRQESLQVRRNMSRKTKNRDGMKGPIGSLRRADSRVSELSPSDATLLIGISIPSSNFMDSKKDSTAYSTVPQSPAVHQVLSEKARPLTPEIVITAAKLDEQWTNSVGHIESRTRPKVASSVYSQAVQSKFQSPKAASIPALSSMSQLISQSSMKIARRTSKRQRTINLQSRVQSWGTEIDEDCSPDSLMPHRPCSGESQLVMLKRSSVESIATRHRSKGWWNQILSPFLERSNTVITRSSPIDDEKTRMPKSSTNYHGFQSPDATELEEDSPQSLVSSTWTDMTRYEKARPKTAMTGNARSLAPSEDAYNPQSRGLVISPEFEAVAGFGAASEYYEACWHDQNSPTSFFKCQNHDCTFQRSRDLRIVEEGTAYPGPGHTSQEVVDSSSNDRDIGDDIPPFRQNAANRFSAAFAEVQAARIRPISETTVIEEDLDTTPEVQEARAAPVARAHRPVQAIRLALESPPSEGSPAETAIHIPTVSKRLPNETTPISQQAISEYFDQSFNTSKAPPKPPNAAAEIEELKSPEAVTPSLERAMASSEAIRLKRISRDVPNGPYIPPPNVYNIHQYHGSSRKEPTREVDGVSNLYPPPPIKPWNKTEEKRWMKATKEERPRSTNVHTNSFKPIDSRAKVSEIYDRRERIDERKKKKKKRRCLFLLIFLGLLAMIALVLGLVIGLTRQHSDIPVQSSWLNLTGYPPIPTGISTIAQPDAVVEDTGCVQPTTMWSCALPKEQQSSVAPNAPDQPNFRVEIRFDNSSTLTNGTASSKKFRRSEKRSGNAVAAGFSFRSHLIRIRDTFANSLFAPNPSPPSDEDQVFLGNTTDNITAPFDGAYTPFFMSFLPTTPIPTKLRKRQSSSNTTDPFPNITQAIPPPELNSDGTAAAANLLPFPVSQPMRLYNRGLPTEHYGFYTYFDRSIFLKSSALVNSSAPDSGPVPDDGNGGSEEDAATVRCTWAQTRFLVQIWTNQQKSSILLPSTNGSAPATSTTSGAAPSQSGNASTSSANDFSRPGSFPYPVSITLDRHGGNIDSKMVYCYGMDDSEHIITDEKKFVLEDRGFGGMLVNPAQGVFGNVNVTFAQGGPGGIDGGTGGCSCQWRNWEGLQ
ncbi:hypothetical protein MMC17_002834 [Xylographa soralifera]|nr:hypothetical protein [Xylographa soralifera]